MHGKQQWLAYNSFTAMFFNAYHIFIF